MHVTSSSVRNVVHIAGGRVERVERIQSLWGGYGEIVRAHLVGARVASVIVKTVRPPPRASEDAASHARKCRSYETEIAFYRSFAPRCDASCRVAELVEHRRDKDGWTLVLEDLDAAGFPTRRRAPNGVALDACIRWLAAFHARFLGAPPDGLWKTGTYWHLDTRRDELAAIHDEALRARAPAIDRALADATYRTIVHGDAKPDNFCFTPDGAHVAAVDFQYVGGGCGMKDVAYLLHGETRATEERALDSYFARLGELVSGEDFHAIEREWRALYPIACEDFTRFLAGWKRR